MAPSNPPGKDQVPSETEQWGVLPTSVPLPSPRSLFQLLAHSGGRCRPAQLLPRRRRRVTLAAAAAAAEGAATAQAAAVSQAATSGRAEGPAAAATAVVPGAPATPPVPVPRAGAAPGGTAEQKRGRETPGTPLCTAPTRAPNPCASARPCGLPPSCSRCFPQTSSLASPVSKQTVL